MKAKGKRINEKKPWSVIAFGDPTGPAKPVSTFTFLAELPTVLPSSVPRCSFLDQKSNLALLRLWRRHEFPDRIKHRQCLPAKNRYNLAAAVPWQTLANQAVF